MKRESSDLELMEDADNNNMFFFLFNLDITNLPNSLSNFLFL